MAMLLDGLCDMRQFLLQIVGGMQVGRWASPPHECQKTATPSVLLQMQQVGEKIAFRGRVLPFSCGGSLQMVVHTSMPKG